MTGRTPDQRAAAQKRAADPGRRRPATHASPAERALLAFGADPAVLDAVLGDLAEERAERAARDGAGAARRWYAREVLRSAPHLLGHAVGSVVRHGTPRQRARLAAGLAAAGLALSVAAAAVLTRHGPPARLVVGANDSGDAVVVNYRTPIQLSTHALDAAGHVLDAAGVRYAWESGAPVPVTPAGVVTCARPGDAVVRAVLGPIATRFRLRCEPVAALRWRGGYDFVLGDTARALVVDAVGLDGRPVTRVVARVRVADSTVATLENTPEGVRIRPLRPGSTEVDVNVGGQWAPVPVTVYEPVESFRAIRPEQQAVAAPVRLAPGAALRWPLPTGLFWLAFAPDPAGRLRPALAVDGPVMCMPAPGPGVDRTHCLVRGPGASVTASHPGRTAREAGGALALLRQP